MAIHPEHLLVGMTQVEDSLAERVLHNAGLTAKKLRKVYGITPNEGAEVVVGQIPFTADTKKVLDGALRHALSLGHNYIGTEHILFALLLGSSSGSYAERIGGPLGKDFKDLTGTDPAALMEDLHGHLVGRVSAVDHPVVVRYPRPLKADAMREDLAGLQEAINKLARLVDERQRDMKEAERRWAVAVYVAEIAKITDMANGATKKQLVALTQFDHDAPSNAVETAITVIAEFLSEG